MLPCAGIVLQFEGEGAIGLEGVIAGDRIAEEEAAEVYGRVPADVPAALEHHASDGGHGLGQSRRWWWTRKAETRSPPERSFPPQTWADAAADSNAASKSARMSSS